jgi:hypothetical protein
MKFNGWSHKDDSLFVICLLVPTVFATARYFESDRQMDQIARAQAKTQQIARDAQARPPLRLAYAQSHGR